jgi:hypothetical protein
MARGLLATLGIGIALFGGLFFAYFIAEYAAGGDGKTEPAVYVGLIVFFGGVLSVGLYLAWRMLRPRPATSGEARPRTRSADRGRSSSRQTAPPATEADRERRILRLAEHERGRVTIPEVAARCQMTIAESKTALDRLVLHQVAETQVTQAGVLVYVFPGFLSDKDKARATDF